MMISKIVLIPFFAGSVMARGRGGGGSVSIDDNWDAPGVQKALMAFAIIFAVFSLVQFVYILKNFTKIPFLSPRAPYIILSITTFFTFLWYLLYGILTRLRDDILDSIATGQVNAALVGFFYCGGHFSACRSTPAFATTWLCVASLKRKCHLCISLPTLEKDRRLGSHRAHFHYPHLLRGKLCRVYSSHRGRLLQQNIFGLHRSQQGTFVYTHGLFRLVMLGCDNNVDSALCSSKAGSVD